MATRRYLVHRESRESMTGADDEIILQWARKQFTQDAKIV